MNRLRLVQKSLLHYWRTNFAVFLGVAAGTAVIGGAIIVGDSVKSSLRQMTLSRLGKIDFSLTGPRFVREDLVENLAATQQSDPDLKEFRIGPFAPAIMMRAALERHQDGSVRRAGGINVFGVDDRAWTFIETATVARPEASQVILSASAADAINAKVGDEVTLWIELPSLVPRDTLMGKKDNDSQEITAKISAIAPESNGLSRLGLQPSQSLPQNGFVNLKFLQEQLGLDAIKPSRRNPVGAPARVNTIFAPDHRHDALAAESGTGPHSDQSRFSKWIRHSWKLADLNLRTVPNPLIQGFVVESEQMILEEMLAKSIQEAAKSMQLQTSPVMVYLANKIWNPAVLQPGKRPGYSMYSTVAGLDLLSLAGTPFDHFEFEGPRPTTWGENEVIINEFLAADLQARIGDKIKFAYHVVGSRGELPELEREVTVCGIVKMSGSAIDRTLTPEVKGITDVDSLANWDQPFPMDLDAVTPRDDEYWDSYRATPKMFLPLATAQSLWPSRYGTLTSVRIAPQSNSEKSPMDLNAVTEEFESELLQRIDPARFGLAFAPVKAIGLSAASGSTDFAQLFGGFSLFLIVAAMILIGLLFRLGVEQRVRELGLLGAIGMTPRQVRRIMLWEGLVTALAGGVFGTILAVSYAGLMIYGLTHWWIGATGTKELMLSLIPADLILGFGLAVVAAWIAIAWALRQLKRTSLREQLAGVIETEVDASTARKRRQRQRRRAVICAILSGLLLIGSLFQRIPAPIAFMVIGILLLTGSLSWLSSWLYADTGLAVRGQGWKSLSLMGLRNATRSRVRTVLTVGMIATATFLIVTVAAFRRDPTGELPVIKSGNGGYTLVAESSSPILYDINTSEGRQKLQLTPVEGNPAAALLKSMQVVPFRVKPGEDASCLNLYQTRVPTILGAPKSFLEEGRFAFASGSWNELLRERTGAENAPIPVIGDLNTLMFSLHKQVGQTIPLPNVDDTQHQLIIRGMLQDSVFQGVLVMSEDDFLKLFPDQKGYRYFLIDLPPSDEQAATGYLETELSEYGFDAEPVSVRLARFLSVQNTYLSTFQTLGGLGLLLGTLGLATVMLRNVLERQSELALLRAVGFQERGVAALVLWESALILSWGLVIGTVTALLAASPNLLSRGADLPWGSLATLLFLVFVSGMAAAAFAVRAAVRLPILATLRGD